MWELLGEELPSGVATAAWGEFEVEIFAVLSDGQVWNRYWDGTSWHEWKPMGGSFIGRPAAAARDSERIDIFALDQSGRAHHSYWNGSKWGDWQAVEDAPEGAVDVDCSWVSERLDLFVRGSDGRLWYRSTSG